MTARLNPLLDRLKREQCIILLDNTGTKQHRWVPAPSPAVPAEADSRIRNHVTHRSTRSGLASDVIRPRA